MSIDPDNGECVHYHQVELANRVGVNEMTIVNWESEGKVPHIKQLGERLKCLILGLLL